jgi:hypothetical protein
VFAILLKNIQVQDDEDLLLLDLLRIVFLQSDDNALPELSRENDVVCGFIVSVASSANLGSTYGLRSWFG